MFFECEFPTAIAFQASGGQMFSTQINEGFSGYEQRNQNWSLPRGKWKTALDHKPLSYFQQVYDFWLNVKGRADAFRFLDPKDCQAVDQVCALVNDSPFTGCVYQLQQTYVAGPRSITKPVYKPITSAVLRFDGTYCSQVVRIYVGGVLAVGWALDQTTGLVTLAEDPGSSPVTWSGQYHLPVRFDTDECNAVIEESDVADGYALITWPGVELYEVRLLQVGAGNLGS